MPMKLTLVGGRLTVVTSDELNAQFVDVDSLYDFYDILQDNDIDIVDPMLFIPERYTRDFSLISVLHEFRCIWYQIRLQKWLLDEDPLFTFPQN